MKGDVMNKKRFIITAGIGCTILLLFLVGATLLVLGPFFYQTGYERITTARQTPTAPVSEVGKAQAAIPTLSAAERQPEPQISDRQLSAIEDSLTTLYEQVNPGVVNVQVFVGSGDQLSGQGAGSGFVLDQKGHIITNNHVIAEASRVTVVFYNGIEAKAKVIGADADSDLAVLQVDELASQVHPLPLADSDQVAVGEWVIAIGNPFSLGGSMTLGIVSATGRTIPSGLTPFGIPQAIQTDAAINPGNSGGPLLNLSGEVIGVNAQIRSGGLPVNTGVGFAIPANVVRRVAPVLIERGSYEWPWLGVEGGDVNLIVKQANGLETQQGAYIDVVIPDSPAAKAGLQGSSGTQEIDGLTVPVGGDVVIEADGNQIANFSDLLATVAFKNPGDNMTLTVLRDSQRQQLTVTLTPRPASLGP
jgi:S1-C subfamily serine protease